MLSSVQTSRLGLIPFSLDLVQAAQCDPREVGALLGAHVLPDWPGADLAELLPFIEDWLAEEPGRAIWTRIVLQRAERTLIGSVGFKAPPDAARSVEIGYGIVPAYRRHGYAVEAARGLIDWAVREHGVVEVTAECLVENIASQGVLARLGMRRTGREGDLLQWVLPVAGGTRL
jgi:RimJ/RimL family protein N-acetyltransferase